MVWQPGNRQPSYNLQPVCYICSLNCFLHLLIMGQCGITSSKTVLVFLNLIFWVSLRCLRLNLRVRQCCQMDTVRCRAAALLHTLFYINHSLYNLLKYNAYFALFDMPILFIMHYLKNCLLLRIAMFVYIFSLNDSALMANKQWQNKMTVIYLFISLVWVAVRELASQALCFL